MVKLCSYKHEEIKIMLRELAAVAHPTSLPLVHGLLVRFFSFLHFCFICYFSRQQIPDSKHPVPSQLHSSICSTDAEYSEYDRQLNQ